MRLTAFLLFALFTAACTPEKSLTVTPAAEPRCHCEGSGKYTIILDAGMGGWSVFWKPVFNTLKKTNRVCLIDRAGYASAEVPASARDARTVAQELHKLFQKNGLTGNLILGGHSMGGLHVRMYQTLYPGEVKGLMLIDAAHPQQFESLPAAFGENAKKQPESLEKVIALAKKDRLKYAKNKIPLNGIPPYLQNEYYAVTTQPEYYFTLKAETENFAQSLAETKETPRLLDSLPLLVMASANSMHPAIFPGKSKNYSFEEHNKIWLTLQKEHAQLSSNTMYVESRSDHYLMLNDSAGTASAILNYYRKNF
ncbi:MAG: alpha/beta hydrolase [Bacteroidia bacterium]|jgi:pimeloyl-ACP methyl ester carboxylesterase|nr:alpha/beta hydrolase [Bacteroidia bacterium]